MRREHLYLRDILEACNLIETFLEGLDAEAFLDSELHKSVNFHFVYHFLKCDGSSEEC
jgi:uncharacterized protein with HEPN domain